LISIQDLERQGMSYDRAKQRMTLQQKHFVTVVKESLAAGNTLDKALGDGALAAYHQKKLYTLPGPVQRALAGVLGG
jgi:uncharacterized protein YifE (UPF0438 family)